MTTDEDMLHKYLRPVDDLLASDWSAQGPNSEWASCAADVQDGVCRWDRWRKVVHWREGDRHYWVVADRHGGRIASGSAPTIEQALESSARNVTVDIEARRANGIPEE